MSEEYKYLIADVTEQCVERDKEIAVLKRTIDLMAEELSRLEIAPPICEGCKQIGGYGRDCEGKECIIWMFERAAKGLFNYGFSE